ncbi:RNI-like protein [Leucogyrophana mollusca]|uniref:RNI-like protein n=1 Tax=Leucogyrophana mollusca TaxID=85980 RepID=A0ACB8B032_9AGAM|nr:RNI-like protein [Leucogyrophana mollusca]
MSRRNNVRGPTSALTEFLRESGINPATIARRVATQNQAQSAAGPSNAPHDQNEPENDAEDNENNGAEASSSRRTRSRTAAGYASDDLDEAPAEEEPSPKKRKTKAATAKAKAKAKKKAEEDAKGQGSDDDEYTAKSLWTFSGAKKPSIGSFEKCAKCEKQFTVTKYTMAANPGPGFLCHQCAKASGADPFKKPAAPRKRNAPADKREVVNYEERRLPSLAAICIELITKYINDVEALGDIGSVNMDEIAKALAKNRGLTPENAHLFYDVQNKKLSLYDATNLTPAAFTTLAMLNPNLTTLRLDYCGQLTCPVLQAFTTSLPHLTSLTLLGPFLVRTEAWCAFFAAFPHLSEFRITQSPRFDEECVRALAVGCTALKELRLKEVGKMGEGFVEPLCELTPLRALDLSDPGSAGGIGEEGWLQLLERHAPTLEKLDCTGHEGVSDRVLLDGLRTHARVLVELTAENVPGLTDEGVADFFHTWSNPPSRSAADSRERDMDVDAPAFVPNPSLHALSLARNPSLSSAALTALLAHSSVTLQALNINGWRGVSAEALAGISVAMDLRRLDVSWAREVDDFVLKGILDGGGEVEGAGCNRLKEVKCWGCSRVSGRGVLGRKVSLLFLEAGPRADTYDVLQRDLKVYGIEQNAAM